MYMHTRDTPAANTADALQVFCGYPLSGPYQVIPRVIFYLLVLIAFWSRTALIFVMLWTSVTAIHVCALAKSHSSAVLDMDMLAATSATILALSFAAPYLMFSRGLKGSQRVDMLATCIWMVLLWIGMVSYVSTTEFQPAPMPCLDSQQKNITLRSDLSRCTFQCYNVSNEHPLRVGQNATLITVPSAFFTGHGKTSGWVVFYCTAVAVVIIIGSVWIARKRSAHGSIHQVVGKKKTKGGREGLAKLLIIPVKLAFWAFVIIIWFSEDALKHVPNMQNVDFVGHWGPLLAFALASIGFFLRLTVQGKHEDSPNNEKSPNNQDIQHNRHAVAEDSDKPEVDIEAQQTTGVLGADGTAPPENVHTKADGPGSEPDDQAVSRNSTVGE